MKTMLQWILYGGRDGGVARLGLDGVPVGGVWDERNRAMQQLIDGTPERFDRTWSVNDLIETVYAVEMVPGCPSRYMRRPDYLARAKAWDKAHGDAS